jgi:hypothetical protein
VLNRVSKPSKFTSRKAQAYRVPREAFFTQLFDPSRQWRIDADLPDDANVTDVVYDDMTRSFIFVVESDTFPEMAEWDAKPIEPMNVVLLGPGQRTTREKYQAEEREREELARAAKVAVEQGRKLLAITEPGRPVKLRGSAQVMTVINRRGPYSSQVAWIDAGGKCQLSEFPNVALVEA